MGLGRIVTNFVRAVTHNAVAYRVRRARLAKGWTATVLAERSGLGRTHINAIERGVRANVTAETLVSLATTLDVSADYLLGLVAKP